MHISEGMVKAGLCLLAAAMLSIVGPQYVESAERPLMKIGVIKDEARPVVDGVLNDASWNKAAVIKEFILSGDNEKGKVANPTEVMLLRDSRNIFIGARCFDSNMKKLTMTDWFEIFIADQKLQVYYHFWIRPSSQTNQDGSPGVFLFTHPQWKGKVSLHQDRWEVEIAIPFFNFSSEYMSSDEWRFNVCRQRYAEPRENTQWSRTGGYFHVPERFGHLQGMAGIDFTPSVEVISEIMLDNRTEKYAYPDYMLLDRSYYTTEKEAVIKLHLSENTQKQLDGKGVQIRVVILDDKGARKMEREVKAGPAAPIYLTFPLSGFADGLYRVKAVLMNGKAEIGSFEASLSKLPPNPVGEVKINRFTRLLLVNGQPFIPIGPEVMFRNSGLAGDDTPENSLQILAEESGFNTLCFWGSYSQKNIEDCAALSLKAVIFPPDGWRLKGEELTASLAALLESCRRHPNILAWCISDEGNLGGSEEDYGRRYRRLKEVDPYRPIFRNESGWVVGYGGPGGLNTTDIYCGGYGAGRLIEAINVDAVPRGIPSMGLGSWIGPVESQRLPTQAETISWAYDVLIDGAGYLMWWGMHNGRPPVPGLWAAARQIRTEADRLTPVLNTEDPGISVAADNKRIRQVIKAYQQQLYLICVNTSDKEEKVSFMLDKRVFDESGQAEILFDGGRRGYDKHMLQDSFPPLARRVYLLNGKRIPGMGQHISLTNKG